MFGTIRKHSTWLWMVIIVVIIISFVVFFTPNIGSSLGQPRASIDINGQTFTQSDLDDAGRDVQLFFLMRNQPAPSRDVLNQLALQRLLVKRLINQYGIAVGSDALIAYIRERIMGGTGSIGGMTYDQYVDDVIGTYGVSREQFESYIRTEVGTEILRATIGSTGALVTPDEARAAYINDNKIIPMEIVYVANSNFVDRVVVNPDEVMKFYSNRVAAYRTPERIQVSYVRLATSNYLAEAEEELSKTGSLELQVESDYQSRSNLFAGMEVEVAKQQIRQEFIDAEAMKVAQRKAFEFVNEYYDLEPKTTATMDAAAQKIGLSAMKAPPFGRSETPEGMAAGFEFVQAAWELSEEEPFSIPVLGPDGYYAIAYEGKVPGAVQPFEEVKERVEEEFREDKARTMAQEAADAFYEAATNAVASGQSFTNLARLSGFHTVSLPELSRRSAFEGESVDLPVSIDRIVQIGGDLEDNTIGSPQFAADGLLVYRVGERADPSEAEIAEGVKEYTEMLASARANDAYTEWFLRQEAMSGIQTVFRDAP